MIRKWIAVFIIFFLGTGALVTVDQACRESTGTGGKAGICICRTQDGNFQISAFGMTKAIGRQAEASTVSPRGYYKP